METSEGVPHGKRMSPEMEIASAKAVMHRSKTAQRAGMSDNENQQDVSI